MPIKLGEPWLDRGTARRTGLAVADCQIGCFRTRSETTDSSPTNIKYKFLK